MFGRITNWIPLWPRCRGRLRRSWLDDVEEDIRTINVKEWKFSAGTGRINGKQSR